MKLLITTICALFTLGAFAQELSPVAINENNFPDKTFREYVVTKIDTDRNCKLSESEIAKATTIDVLFLGIKSLKGIEYFTALECLKCSGNNLTSLNLGNNTALKLLVCYDNQLTSLDLKKNTALEELYCARNKFSSLDLEKNTALKRLDCNGTNISFLNLENNKALKYLLCFSIVRKLGTVDFNGFTVDGLDMERVSNVVGAKIINGKFVPTNDTITEITYDYNTKYVEPSMRSQSFKLKVSK